MGYIYAFAAGLLVGGGMAYAFRGWIIRKRMQADASLKDVLNKILVKI